MEFSNSEIDITSLPTTENIRFQTLDKRYHQLLKTESILISTVLIVVCAASFFIWPMLRSWPWVAGVILLFIAVSVILLWTGFQSWHFKGYALRQHDILFKTGIWFKSMTVIAFNRIQHVEIQQGPLDRLFSVSSLTLYTAGGSASDLTIPGLHPDDAARLKDHITRKSSRDEEE